MTLSEIKNTVMFQTNNDEEDISDFLPSLTDYINEAYDRLVFVWAYQHVDESNDTYYPLTDDSDEPMTPAWTHRYLADWATWLCYRNGNPQKQQRGMAYRESFLQMLAKISDMGGINGLNEDGSMKKYKKFINIPR